MKVIPTSSPKYNQNYGKSNLSLPQATVNNTGLKSGVAFGSAKGGFSKFMNKLGGGNFLVEFFVLDALSMIAPRVWIGLKRDREKLGHLNYQAGAEETVRECISGPSIFLIPMVIMHAYKKFRPASHIPDESMYNFTSTMHEITQESDANTLNNKGALDKKLAEKVFDKTFGDFPADNKDVFKTEFTKILTDDKSKTGKKQFESLIARINAANKNSAPINSNTIKFNKLTLSSAELYEDFYDYSKDVVNRLTKQSFAEKAKDVKGFLEKLYKQRMRTKTLTAVTGFFALGAFLLYLPKIYKMSNISPAMQSADRARKEGEELGGANEN